MKGGLTFAIAALAATQALAVECPVDRLTVEGGFGRARFTVQVADDAGERAQGLMQVEELATLGGMLFVYDDAGSRSFWMKNTLIPLDMLFAAPDGTITHIHENARPLDTTPIPGGDGVQFVLEINGGLAGRLGIEPGDRLHHAAIDVEAACR